MEKLKIGDKVYNKEHSRWGNNIYYYFGTVERLTKTQAILNDGTKLINEPTKNWSEEYYSFMTYGNRYKRWYLTTKEIILEAKSERERQQVIKWFENRKFNDEEKVIIYNQFKDVTQ